MAGGNGQRVGRVTKRSGMQEVSNDNSRLLIIESVAEGGGVNDRTFLRLIDTSLHFSPETFEKKLVHFLFCPMLIALKRFLFFVIGGHAGILPN